MNIPTILNDIEQNLFLPKKLISCKRNDFSGEFKCKVEYGIVDDCSVLSCGCCISDLLYGNISSETKQGTIQCPICDSVNVSLIGPVKQLRNLYQQLQYFSQQRRQNLETITKVNEDSVCNQIAVSEGSVYENRTAGVRSDGPPGSAISPRDIAVRSHHTRHDYYSGTPNNQKSLIALFHSLASRLGSDSITDNINTMDAQKKIVLSERRRRGSTTRSESNINEDIESNINGELKVLDNVSNTRTIPVSQDSITTPIKDAPQNLAPSVSIDEEREYYFAKCFPVYRKRSQFNTHSKFLRTKSKLFINMSISPDCSKFALLTEHRWEVYSIPTESTNQSPVLLFCGKSTGEYGPDFGHLNYPKDSSVLFDRGSSSNQNDSWEHLYCKLSNDFLVISGSKKRLRVFDLSQNGQPIHSSSSTFPIRCIDIDANSNLIACGITGMDRNTGAEQALIVFHKIEKNNVTFEPEFLPPTTITLPYRDPINTLQFSEDGLYLSCSTALESRFLIISLRKINEPRLIMKSLRSIDTSLESEGITDTKLFPGNPNLMCVTSTAFNSPPIVINTKIQSIDGVQTVAQPTMLIRLDELGSKIHKCEISPRNDSIAFLDRNGSVYIMFAPTMMDNEKRRIVVVDIVANAYRAHESAALRFSSDGHKLYILDRKGMLYLEDFSYGLPQEQEVTKCKKIN
ncbi:hypothetical protein HG535_0C04670 [Zygotorulaspora mrakii]|uniref:SPS-sensor component PTR3 n=1 Tax=Zygotorulaspora mrakii TaxID=42260 RepID=A0A7H9B0S2_ZYGMR|nr:uncharacterized protein HG535_0C04670 [Zygotorulaspora mrakii]QLG72113.1 hypothetical protein HG535_0C04670 [Zygotorulaspora mrakii]